MCEEATALDSRAEPIREAARRGDTAGLQVLLEAGADPNPPGSGWGALALAAYHGRAATVRMLLARGQDPNFRECGMPVLVLAANVGRVSVVRELLSAGADPNLPSFHDDGSPCMSAIHYAVSPDGPFPAGHVGVVKLLLRHGVPADARDPAGATPLMLVREGDLRMLEVLCRAGADVNARDRNGWTPLTYAVLQGSPANVAFLLRHGADPSVRDHRGLTALGYLGFSECRRMRAIAESVHRAGHPSTPEDHEAIRLRLDELRRDLPATRD